MASALQLMCRIAPLLLQPLEAVCVCESALPLLWTFPPLSPLSERQDLPEDRTLDII